MVNGYLGRPLLWQKGKVTCVCSDLAVWGLSGQLLFREAIVMI